MSSGSGSSRLRVALHLGLLVLGVGAFALWLGYVWIERHDLTVWDKDWYCFYSAGKTFLAEGASQTYVRPCNENYFWMYPPYMLYPWAAVSRLAPLTVYVLVMTAVVGAATLSLGFIRATFRDVASIDTILLFVIGSAGLLATLVVGQHSGLLLLGAAGALWAMRSDRDLVAGAFLGLMGIKPNWAAVFVLWLLVTRRWRVLGAMAAVGGLMILSTFPMGYDAWHTYLTVVPDHVRTLLNSDVSRMTYPAHKLITAEAFARSSVGVVSPVAGTVFWLLLDVVVVAAALFVWIRSMSVADQIAVAVLAAIAANVYAEFYEALVLAVPAAVWWAGRASAPRGPWLTAGGAALAVWLTQWIWTLGSPGPGWPSVVGGLLTLWVVAVAVGTLRASGGDAPVARA